MGYETLPLLGALTVLLCKHDINAYLFTDNDCNFECVLHL